MDTNLENQMEPHAQENILLDIPMYKLFNLNQVVLGTFFGGPIAGAYMLGVNFKRLGLHSMIWKTWVFVLGVYLLVFLPDLLGIELPLPNLVYNAISCAMIYYFGKRFQGNYLQYHDTNEGAYELGSKVFGVVIISIIILVAFLAGLFILADFEGFKEMFVE